MRLGRHETVVVIHDAAEIASRIADELDTADARLRPGLEAAARLVAEFRRDDDQLVLRWAEGVLEASAPEDELTAIRDLRRAAPGMSLVTARALAAATFGERG